MKNNRLPSLSYLNECFLYDARTGKLFWKERPAHHFSSARSRKRWNTRFSGREALAQEPGRYRYGSIGGQHVYAHRIIWKMHTGEEPPPILDHKNRNKADNRFSNLRAATVAQNAINSDFSKGVCFDVSRGKWMAFTKFNQKMVNIGRFATREEAVLARRAKIEELFGEFVP